jgi:DNA-binding protein|tara:strand:+ start:1962 stop:2246 length:285 start_codon:yes stop_codon:yes gene_type:complete
MSNSTIDYTIEKFLISNEPVMKIAIDVLEILGKINKLTMKGSGESCPPTVAVANIITQNMLKGKTKIDKILVDSEVLDDGRLISIIEVTITKIN